MTDEERKAASLNLDMELAQAQETNEASEQEHPKHFGGNVTGQELPLNTSIRDWLLNTASQYSGIAGGDENAQILALENHYAQTRAFIDYMYALRRNENPPLPAFHSINTPDTKLSIFVNGKIIEPSFVARFLDERQITISANGTIYSGETELTRRDLINLIKTDISIYVTDGTYKKAKELAEAVIGAAPQKKGESSFMSIEELRKDPPKPHEFIIRDFIPVGLCVIAAAPKAGKSLFCVALADAVATGQPLWDSTPTAQGDVLYMAMEEGADGFWQKFEKIGGKAQHGITVMSKTDDSCTINHGLTELLDKWRQGVQRPKLVVIDTLVDVKDPTAKGRTSYEADARQFGKLQKYANDNDLCILLVTHLRKTDGRFKADDPFDSVQGSKGLGAKVDAQFMITGFDKERKFYVRGRHTQENVFEVALENCRWVKQGTEEEMRRQREINKYNQSPLVRTIRQMVDKHDRWVTTATEIWNEVLEFTKAVDGEAKQASSSTKQLGTDLTGLQARLLKHDRIMMSRGSRKEFIFERSRNT